MANAASGLRDTLEHDSWSDEEARLMVRVVWELGWPADTDDEDCVAEAAEAVADDLLDEDEI